MPAASHTEVFNCSVSEFFKIVSDYEKYPEFLQEVKECKVVKSDGAKKLIEFKVSVIKSFTYQLWMTEQAPSQISWVFARGDVFKTSTGSWKIKPENAKLFTLSKRLSACSCPA
jgi:coenzyme Q-binding protein COQ10